MKIRIILTVFFIVASSNYMQGIAQNLTSIEREIIKTVEKNNSDAIELFEEVVNINSGTLNLEGIKKVGMVFKESFDSIKFTTRWIDMPKEVNRGGHLFAKTLGSKGKKILIIGHLDTVFEEDSPFQKFKRLNDSIAYAPGGYDMKGGNIIALYALRALSELKLLNDAEIVVAFTGDEESPGLPLSVTRKDLIDAAKNCDIALGFEPSVGYEYATVARRGLTFWKLEAKGERGHSSRIFNERYGAGAIFETSRILAGFYDEVKGEKYLTLNPGILVGGTSTDFNTFTSKGSAFGKANIIPQSSMAYGGLRFISHQQQDRAREKMQNIVNNNLPKTSATISFDEVYPAMEITKGNISLLEELNSVSIDLGQGEVNAYDPGKRGTADICFVAKYVDCLDGLGIMGAGAHTTEETVNLNTMEALTKRTAILIYRLINQ